MKNDTRTKAIARERISKALVLIEKAQNDLERASQELSAIINGGMRLQELAFKERMRVNAIWHKINNALERDRRNLKFDLDGIHIAALDKKKIELTVVPIPVDTVGK